MKVKDDSVNIWGLQPEMQPVLRHASLAWKDFVGEELVVTSARDGRHSSGSMHYYGYAVDLRTWDSEGKQIDSEIREALAKHLRIMLANYSAYYDVIAHTTHIHVEYDYVKAQLIR